MRSIGRIVRDKMAQKIRRIIYCTANWMSVVRTWNEMARALYVYLYVIHSLYLFFLGSTQVLLRQKYNDKSAWKTVRIQIRFPRTGSRHTTGQRSSVQISEWLVHDALSSWLEIDIIYESASWYYFFIMLVKWIFSFYSFFQRFAFCPSIGCSHLKWCECGKFSRTSR